MTLGLFEPDLLKPPGRLRLQYDTWAVVSRGVLQNVSSRPSRRKPFQVEFRASEFDKTICCSACKCVHVMWDLAVQPLLAKEKPLPESTIAGARGKEG
jgi:hypothetical protein